MNFNSIGLSQITALLSVLLIDLTLAVDNAVVMGTVAASLSTAVRRKAILIGVAGAALFRILFACFAMRMLAVVGLTLAGGLLLLWVSYKLWREIHRAARTPVGETSSLEPKQKSLSQAIWQILFADISMSLDNTLAVAGAARNHFWIMVGGLTLSVVLMAIAANLLASLVHRYRWISYVGLVIVVYVAGSMIWEGVHSLMRAF